MSLADELRGISIRRPLFGSRRRVFCEDDGVDVKRELRLQRQRAYMQQYRIKNRERMKAKAKIHREKNKEILAALKRQWRLDNIEHVRAYQAKKSREWRRLHPDRANEINRRYKQANKAELAAKERVYRQTHREAINARQREYRARKKREARSQDCR